MCRDWRMIELLRESMQESALVVPQVAEEMDTINDCLRKRGLDVRQARRMVQDRSEWRGFVRWNAWDVARGMNP